MDVSRYVETEELAFDVEFLTPTFLGGADGNAEIRTAPFKNLLRRWWRIANGDLSTKVLWAQESRLFGSTEKDPAITETNRDKRKSEKKVECFGKSKVQLRIEKTTIEIEKDSKLQFSDKIIQHPEVKKKEIPVESYLGMGPVFWNKDKRLTEYEKTYIKSGSKISMVLSVPKGETENFIYILTLINYLGTIGSRSRNSWGSLAILPEKFKLEKIGDIREKSKLWGDYFSDDKCYPHFIGKDHKGLLVWRIDQVFKEHVKAMVAMAEIYKNLRLQFKFTSKDKKEERHLLGYPVTNHRVIGWDRLPSQIILKVAKNGTVYNGLIIHIPNKIPEHLQYPHNQKEIWKDVHNFLDNYKDEYGKNLKRFGGNPENKPKDSEGTKK